ncbi:MAG: HDOD domain-containing protein [Gammaproteobacteria bacterium]
MPIAQLLVEEEIQNLQIKSSSYSPGSIIFNRGCDVDSLAYVIKGSVFLEAGNGSGQEISAETLKALFPLSTGSFHHLTAIAKTQATLIFVPQSIFRFNRSRFNPLENKWQASEQLQNNPFFNLLFEYYQREELKIPSFPEVALKLRRATQNQDIGIADVVKIINLDPVIAAKLIQVVNSPIYRTVNPITNCHDAVNRLGLTTTRNLVTAISMKNLIRSEKPIIKKRIQQTWMQSIRVSGISYTLARLSHKAIPEEALLAGLLHNIGALPVLMFADTLPPENYSAADIDLCINELQGPLGSLILEQWDFPENLKNLPLQSRHWFEDTGPEVQLSDIVLLAKFHDLLSNTGGIDLPLICTLPAFQKLENQLLTPELSLQILRDAKQQIGEAMSFFMI